MPKNNQKFALMVLTLLIPYITSILVATVVGIVRTSGFYPIASRKENPEAWHHYYGMLFLTGYLAINLVTETVGVIMARNNFYNHYLYAINILITQFTLVACFCYFTRLNRLMIAYGVLMLCLSLYIYADNAYWRPDTVMPQSVYAGNFAVLSIASMLFGGINMYHATRNGRHRSYWGLTLICVCYHVYGQLSNSFLFGETIAKILQVSELYFYLFVYGMYYLAIAWYLATYKTSANAR